MKYTLLRTVVEAALCAWFLATAASQHPDRNFDRCRNADPLGFLPNWRFFAPEPARFDFYVLYRVTGRPAGPTLWQQVCTPEPRRWRHALWFPTRRHDKALLDICGSVLGYTSIGRDAITDSVPYRLLRKHVRHHIATHYYVADATGFQFVIVRDSGHADNDPIPAFVSGDEPLSLSE